MSTLKDGQIYPKFEFRLSPEEKVWLQAELDTLKEKYNSRESEGIPAVSKSDILVAALRHGLRYLKSHRRLGNSQD